MPISSEKKKQYNEKYRNKLKQQAMSNDEKPKVIEVQSTPPIIPQSNFFLNLRNKMLETTIMAAFPILLKVIHHHFSKRQLQVESKVESQPSENTASNPLNNLQMSHNF